MSEQPQHGGFPRYKPAAVGPDYGPLIEALRTVQDLAVSTDLPQDVTARARAAADDLVAIMEPYVVPEGRSPAGRVPRLPGRGNLLNPPWTIEEFGADGVRMRGTFRRFHLGGNAAAHGGVLSLLFDDLAGLTQFAAGRPIGRTAYLHVNYRKVTPLNVELTARARVDRVEGRKAFITAELCDPANLHDGEATVLADCEALMVALRPWQP